MNEEDLKDNTEQRDEEATEASFNRDRESTGKGAFEADRELSDEEVDQLLIDQQERISELEREMEELKESNLRKAAELDNIRKRIQRERAQLFDSARSESIEQFLPVNDDLRRTLQALRELEGDKRLKGVLDGVRLVAEKFEEVLKRYNVERIDETGVPFDVDLHDALMRRKAEDEDVESNTVLEVLENGYRMGDKTIRFAKVIVSE